MVGEVAEIGDIEVFVPILSLIFLAQRQVALLHCVHINLH